MPCPCRRNCLQPRQQYVVCKTHTLPRNCLHSLEISLHLRVCDLRAKSSASVVIEAPTPDAIAATWDNHDNLVVLQLNNTITHIDPRRKRTHKPQVFREGDEATDVAFIEGGRKLLISTRYGVEVWSWPALDCLTVLVGHLSHHGRDGGVTAMAVSKQDRLLASGGMDAQICIWDLQAGIPLTVAHQPDGIIRALSFNTDQQMLAYSQSPVAGQQPYLDVVSAVTGKFMYRVPIAEPTESIAFNPRYPRILAFAAEKYYSGYKDRSSKEIYYGRIGVISFGR
eukprot:GHRR01028383.1.p1 GENE.GHRR01028383.1~~GHRR01028383.1.p1  ORF type:complete len:282 (+),score=66.92 GHRR01028383.1:151-996(+)